MLPGAATKPRGAARDEFCGLEVGASDKPWSVQVGFEVIPRRWVVERTFGWMIRWRRLVRDYEKRLDVSEAMVHVAMVSLLLRRIAHQ